MCPDHTRTGRFHIALCVGEAAVRWSALRIPHGRVSGVTGGDVRFLYLLVDETSPSPQRVDRRLREGQAVMPEGWRFDVRPIRIGPDFYEESVLGHALAVPGIVDA